MSNGKRTYEGMFLLDAGNSDFQAASEPITRLLDRAEADVLSIKPWEERRLAYEIRGRKRGLYVLTYFSADPARITELEHDCELDERVLRALILRRDHLDEAVLNADTPATTGQKRAERHAEAVKAEEAAAKAKEAPAAPAAAGPAEDKPADPDNDEDKGDKV